VAADKTSEHIGEIGLRIDLVQFAGLNQGRKDGPVLAATCPKRDRRGLDCDLQKIHRTGASPKSASLVFFSYLTRCS
jgi:hypothetical protein